MSNANQKPNPGIAVAVLLVLIGAVTATGYFLTSNEKKISNVFNEAFTAYPNVLTSASRGDNAEAGDLQNIMSLYENGEYEKLIKEINAYLKYNTNEYQLKFYRGIAYLETGNTANAIKDFEDVLLMNRELSEQAEWYLALSYLKLKNNEKAFDILSAIAQKDNAFSDKAKGLLADLNGSQDIQQEKFYQIASEGQYEFYYWEEENPVQHPVTERTFFLEATRNDVIPAEISYQTFRNMTVEEKQQLLNNAQQEILAAMEKSKQDLYEEIKNATQLPDVEALAKLEQEKIEQAAANEEMMVEETNPVDMEEEVYNDTLTEALEEEYQEDTMAAEKPATRPQPRRVPMDLGLPWVVDVMLRAETGTELPDNVEYQIGSKKEDIPMIVKEVTRPLN